MSLDPSQPSSLSPSSSAASPSGLPTTHEGVHMPDVPTHLLGAILTTFFCCLPIGVIAIICASQVQARQHAGDYDGAVDMSKKARFWVIAGPVAWALIVIVYGGLALLHAVTGP